MIYAMERDLSTGRQEPVDPSMAEIVNVIMRLLIIAIPPPCKFYDLWVDNKFSDPKLFVHEVGIPTCRA